MMGLPVPELLAVRVQDGLHGLSADAQGARIAYQRDSVRNTLHFSLDGMVGDHAYGSFNQDAQGNLKGSVVIVAPLSGLPTPAGLGQVDTWFRMDTRAAKEGEAVVERSLGVGRAIVVAPEGSAVPAGIQAIYYSGGVAERDQAVDEAFGRFGVERKVITAMRAWPGQSETQAREWAERNAAELYPNAKHAIHCDTHDSGADADLERFDSRGLLESLRRGRFTEDESGAEITLADLAQERAQKGREAIEAFLGGLPADERARLQAHSEWHKNRLAQDAAAARALDAEWVAKGEAQFKAEVTEKAESGLARLPGEGDFFVARAGFTQSVAFGPKQMAEALASEAIAPDDQIWRSGMAAEWSRVSDSPVGRLAQSLGVLAPSRGAPAPSAPPVIVAPPPPFANESVDIGRLGAVKLSAWRDQRELDAEIQPLAPAAPERVRTPSL